MAPSFLLTKQHDPTHTFLEVRLEVLVCVCVCGVGKVCGGGGEDDPQSAKTHGGQTELVSFMFTVSAEGSDIQEVTPPLLVSVGVVVGVVRGCGGLAAGCGGIAVVHMGAEPTGSGPCCEATHFLFLCSVLSQWVTWS